MAAAKKKAVSQETNWNEVIGRSLARFALDRATLKDNGLATKARFLMGLGVSRREAAEIP